MIQNLKVDIIYYKTNTDFEMEFNLCGCCRMRLLTDKAADKKTLIHDLARAVSRSRVIIIAGVLYGEDGIIETTAKSIAKTVTEIDKAMYGVKTEKSISVINGATPLVAPDGEFGGCIIESGPQSMILLSDDRELRKAVMKTLIYPYIEELCALDLNAKAKNANKDASAVVPSVTPQDLDMPEIKEAVPESEPQADTGDTDDTETVTDFHTEDEPLSEELPDSESKADDQEDKAETEEIVEQPEEADAEEPSGMPLSAFSSNDDDVKLENGMLFEDDSYSASSKTLSEEEKSELFVEPEKLKKSRIGNYNRGYAEDALEDSPYHTSGGTEEKRKSEIWGNPAILIISVLLLIILAVLCYCIFYVPAKDGVTATAYLRETFNTLFG